MTNERSTVDPEGLPAPVTGVARAGHGTGTALDDTQLYDLADFSPVAPEAARGSERGAAEAEPPRAAGAEPVRVAAAPIEAAPAVAAPVAAASAASTAAPTRAPVRTISTSRTRRVGAPVAGLAGFALAAGLAILIGAVLGGVPMPDGAAAGGEPTGPTTTAAPARTEAPDDDDDDDEGERDGGGGGGGGNGRGGGNGNGNNGNGNGNGRGNGNGND